MLKSLLICLKIEKNKNLKPLINKKLMNQEFKLEQHNNYSKLKEKELFRKKLILLNKPKKLEKTNKKKDELIF